MNTRIFQLIDDAVRNLLENRELVSNLAGDAFDEFRVRGRVAQAGLVSVENRLDGHFEQTRFRLIHQITFFSGSVSRIKEIWPLVYGDWAAIKMVYKCVQIV